MTQEEISVVAALCRVSFGLCENKLRFVQSLQGYKNIDLDESQLSYLRRITYYFRHQLSSLLCEKYHTAWCTTKPIGRYLDIKPETEKEPPFVELVEPLPVEPEPAPPVAKAEIFPPGYIDSTVSQPEEKGFYDYLLGVAGCPSYIHIFHNIEDGRAFYPSVRIGSTIYRVVAWCKI